MSSDNMRSGISFSGLTTTERRKHPLYKPLKRVFRDKIQFAMNILDKTPIDEAEVTFLNVPYQI